MSAFGPKRTCATAPHMSAFGGKADVTVFRSPLFFREFVVAGGLASYGASLADLYRRKAGFIDKILKGANPAEMPIERPTKFEFLINLKTAKAFGLKIPQGLVDVADEVIE